MKINTDMLIFGGGIAGLWTAARLKAAGYAVVVVTDQGVGGGQTLASQGIIHAGLKYALLGQVNDMAKLVAGLAADWQAAIAGTGDIDLRGTRLLARTQHLLMPGGLIGMLAGVMGHAAIGQGVGKLAAKDWPGGLKDLGFKGSVIHMDEPGIDVPSLLEVFAKLLAGKIYTVPPTGLTLNRRTDGSVDSVTIGDIEITAQRYIGAAAAGNEQLAAQSGVALPVQHRPLRMLLIKGQLPQLFLHGVGSSFRPLFTISAHPAADGDTVWYIGGQVAEDAVHQDAQTVRHNTQKALRDYFPKLDFSDKLWAVHDVTRVESQHPQGWLPDKPVTYRHHNMIFAWPNKLTFAPLLARDILQQLQRNNITPQAPVTPLPLPIATMAPTIWDDKPWQIFS